MTTIYGTLFVNWLKYDNGHFQHLIKRGVSPEIGLEHGGFDLPLERHRQTAAVIKDQGLRAAIHLPFTGIRPGADQDQRWHAAREQLLRALEIAAVYEPDHLIGHPEFRPGLDSLTSVKAPAGLWGKTPAPPSPGGATLRRGSGDVQTAGPGSNFIAPSPSSAPDPLNTPGPKWLARSSELWMEVLRQTEARLYLENTVDRSPAAIMALLDTLPGRAAMCFDIGHWFSAADGMILKNLPGWIVEAAPRLGHLHLHDNHGHNDEHLGMGRGLIDFDDFFALLGRYGLDPTFTLEAHSPDSLDASLDWLARRGIGGPARSRT